MTRIRVNGLCKNRKILKYVRHGSVLPQFCLVEFVFNILYHEDYTRLRKSPNSLKNKYFWEIHNKMKNDPNPHIQLVRVSVLLGEASRTINAMFELGVYISIYLMPSGQIMSNCKKIPQEKTKEIQWGLICENHIFITDFGKVSNLIKDFREFNPESNDDGKMFKLYSIKNLRQKFGQKPIERLMRKMILSWKMKKMNRIYLQFLGSRQ